MGVHKTVLVATHLSIGYNPKKSASQKVDFILCNFLKNINKYVGGEIE